jgi:predicted N-acetyltransferase YhbS
VTQSWLRLARPEDVERLDQLIRDLAAWARGRGVDQWGNGYPREWLLGEIRRGETYVHEDAGEIAASLVLQERDAAALWEPAPALYLERLCVDRRYAGQRLGARLVTWAEERVRERGQTCLRGVCDDANRTLKSYYESLGFENRGSVFYAPYEMYFARYEKKP